MSQPESNYVPWRGGTQRFFMEGSKPSLPEVRITVSDTKKPLGFAPWPDDPKPEWKKA